MLHGSNGYSPLSEVRGLVHDSITVKLVPGPISPVCHPQPTGQRKPTRRENQSVVDKKILNERRGRIELGTGTEPGSLISWNKPSLGN